MPQPESPQTSVNELLHAQFEVLLAEYDLVANNATYGQTFNDMNDSSTPKDENSYKKSSKQNSMNASSESKPPKKPSTVPSVKMESVVSLLEYLRGHVERLLVSRAIGSGLIEGACKNLVGRRLKQTGVCRRLPRANRMAINCAVLYANQRKFCRKYAN